MFGDIYWTCKSAGVILTHSEESGEVSLVLNGLQKPSGIAICPFGLDLFYSELPTPGVSGANGGTNRVSLFNPFSGQAPTVLDMGDPEPTDVALGADGTLYWTCTRAGVIVEFKDGVETVVLRNLSRPTGLAIDQYDNLYFTELPTPGLPGTKGGKNRVSKFDQQNNVVTVIADGEPEPRDVTVAYDGTVYWTDATVGAIFGAKPRR
jgi:hypothetical protein